MDATLAVSRWLCLGCLVEMRSYAFAQLPMFSHGGYGEAQRTELRVCPNGCTMRVASVRAERP